MDDTSIPKQLLYEELAQGKRQRGRPKLRYKDTCKVSLSRCDIDVKTWEETAEQNSVENSSEGGNCSTREQNEQQADRETRAPKGQQQQQRALWHLTDKYIL